MAGIVINNLASQLGLKTVKSIAYGEFNGYMLTLSEKEGNVAASFAAKFKDDDSRSSVYMALDGVLFKREHAIKNIIYKNEYISVLFQKSASAKVTEKITSGIEKITQVFKQNGLLGADSCSICGGDLRENGVLKLYNGVALPMHAECAAELEAARRSDLEEKEKKQKGYGSGILGAVLGGIIGAIPWGIGYYFGWFVGWFGLLIGFCARKGYELLKGKDGKGKLWIVIAASVAAMLLIQYVSTGIDLYLFISAGELEGAVPADTLWLLNDNLLYNAEFRSLILKDVGLGLLFVFLGIGNLIKEIAQQNKDNIPELTTLE